MEVRGHSCSEPLVGGPWLRWDPSRHRIRVSCRRIGSLSRSRGASVSPNGRARALARQCHHQLTPLVSQLEMNEREMISSVKRVNQKQPIISMILGEKSSLPTSRQAVSLTCLQHRVGKAADVRRRRDTGPVAERVFRHVARHMSHSVNRPTRNEEKPWKA